MTRSRPRSNRLVPSVCGFALCGIWACSEAQEADRVELRVVSDGAGLTPVTTDLGYAVQLSSASMAVDDLKFTISGEVHASFGGWLSNLVLPEAHAHPGHFQGGEIIGELPGHFVLRFAPDQVEELGTATLLVGTYRAVNLTLSLANGNDVEDGDPLAGHTAVFRGAATRDGESVAFDMVIDSPEGRELVGIPFEQEITTDTRHALALRFSPLDSLEMDTLFDGVDFAALDGDGDGHVAIAPAADDEPTLAAYNAVRRAFQTHDHFLVLPRN